MNYPFVFPYLPLLLTQEDFTDQVEDVITRFRIPSGKLERMFVWQLETNPSCAAIAGGLIRIAKDLNIHIIAEGVETENQLNTLNGYEYEYQQGFYYAPAMEKETLIKVLGCTLEE